MSRLQLIEQKIVAMDGAAFQNLCDVYIALKETERTSFNRTGSQLGKQKTVKGTPDTFFRLTNGNLSFVEFTTTEKGLLKKIKEDIDKCLDDTKTGVKPEDVKSIVVCFNSRLSVKEETEIQEYAREKDVFIKLVGIDDLSVDIYSKYLIIAKDILGIPLDTGQILPLDMFMQEYNNKGGQLSTPLDNRFLHRGSELEKIGNELDEKDLLILTGAAGVGKTKVGLEAIKNFLAKNHSFSAYAIAKKDVDILDDLRIHLDQEKDFILLVDDANRQLPNLGQILGVFKEQRKGKIKVLLTVRDYAVSDILKACGGLLHGEIELQKFSDKEITEIIESDSFQIRHSEYQKRIVELADGNARLAIMAARLAKEKNQEFLYGTVFELYDEYFQTFVKDFDTLGNSIALKTLGLLSFFFSIRRDDKAFIQKLLQLFGLDHYAFNEAINELEKRELIEVQYDVARVSEQVTATYFFYKVFIQDKLLSFESLLFNYFPQWRKRFSDTIIPANNTFGYDAVLSEIEGTLSSYLNSVKNDEEKALAFFSLFWPYKRTETLAYFHQKVFNFPEPVNPTYETHYEHNDHVWDKDQIINHLSDFFGQNTESLLPALELAFEYCRRVPEKLPVLIRRIRERLHFEYEDEIIRYARQRDLFKVLISKAKEGHAIYQKAFFALSGSFLKHKYRITEGGRGNTFTMYDYSIPNTETIRAFRSNIWNTLLGFFQDYPEDVLKVLHGLKPDFQGVNAEILTYDISLLLPFIEQHFDPNIFAHVYYVNELVIWFDREELPDRSYRVLKSKFTSDAYKMFRKLDWNRLRDKHEYDFENYEEYNILKEKDVKESFVFTSLQGFPTFLEAINNSFSVERRNGAGPLNAVDIVVKENFLREPDLGLELLQELLTNYPVGQRVLYKSLGAIIQYSEDYAARLWNILQNWKHEQQLYWLLSFFDYLPDYLINSGYRDKLIATVKSIDKGVTINDIMLERFVVVQSDIIVEITKIVAEKVQKEDCRISYWPEFYEKFADHFKGNIELLERTYLQQESMDYHHDYEKKGLRRIITMSPHFLLTYTKTFYANKNSLNNRDAHNGLGFVWDVVPSTLIEEAIDEIVDANYFIGIGDFPVEVFFNNLNEGQTAKAKAFLSSYIDKHHRDSKRMNIAFDVMRTNLPDFREEALLHYLTINGEVEHFRKVDWAGNPGVLVNNNAPWGELNAERWRKVADVIAKHPNQLKMIPIKAYVSERIASEIRQAEQERKNKFINPYW